ncbi:hypothetical protein B0T18DRAFT_394516 [Schizothecium vesticola]|uniref:Uncharacterized protein n=1 Tax=Schizothecium vesticola TaxID=314040 RepID=A0AA40BPT0_9PEZI|nr:hypothetical protein B0T18DRAFT_394516 [Schizothecium vesticola]
MSGLSRLYAHKRSGNVLLGIGVGVSGKLSKAVLPPAPSLPAGLFGSPQYSSPVELRASGSSEHAPSISARQFEADVKQQKSRLMDDLVGLVIKGSEELQKVSGGFKVELERHWLPSHGTSVPPDERDREDIFRIDRRKLTPEPGIFASLKSPLLVPPPGFLALFHPAQQGSSVTGATEETMDGVDSALISRHRELEEAKNALADQNKAMAEEKKVIADERKAIYEKEKALGEERKALDEEKRVLGEEKKVIAQKNKEQREAEQGLMDRDRAVTK